MTQDFTTPEFADLLKKHGIEVDTPFYHYYSKEYGELIGILHWDVFTAISVDKYIQIIGEDIEANAKPAYSLMQVLRWLPSLRVDYKGEYHSLMYKPKSGKVDYLALPEDGFTTMCGFFQHTIEQLITQGLKEGWLNKDNLNL